jgi:hypothetical protein
MTLFGDTFTVYKGTLPPSHGNIKDEFRIIIKSLCLILNLLKRSDNLFQSYLLIAAEILEF